MKNPTENPSGNPIANIENQEKLRDVTLVFLVKREGSAKNAAISEVCLALKKRGFGKDRWNGVGGKVEKERNEKIPDAAVREAQEEIMITPHELYKVADLSFYFPHNKAWSQNVHVFFSEKWDGEPIESDEMKPQWFKVSEIPYNSMWIDDVLWLPEALRGNLIEASFVFNEDETIKDKDVKVVDGF